jgi:integrase
VIDKTWPELNNLDIRKISEKQCLTWAKKLAELYSPSVYNNTVGTLRQILQLATKAGVRFANPAMEIRRKPVRAKQLQLPSQDQFKAFIQSIIDGNGRFSRDCSCLVQFLAYGGFRIGEAGQITWEDIDLERGEITVKGDPITGTKNSEIRIVPIIPPMRNLLLEIKSERNDEPTSQKVMRVFECQKAMNRAAKITGMSRITHHYLRHLFATRCIESGVDIPTVARWLGHKDGGALAMKVYGHLRDEHSQQMAEIVHF